MHFWRSWGSILHKLLSGKSTYGWRETELYSGARRMFRESRMCLQTIHHIYAMKGEITGMIARAMVIVSIQVETMFAPEGCDNLLWRSSQYFQNMLWLVSKIKDLVSQAIWLLHPIICFLANKQVNLDGRWTCLPKCARLYSPGWLHNSMCLSGQLYFVVCVTIAISLFLLKLSLIKLS